MSAQGIITGGGMEKERNAEQLGGEQAYSFHIGDKYYSFRPPRSHRDDLRPRRRLPEDQRPH
jgi:hypothetical protein